MQRQPGWYGILRQRCQSSLRAEEQVRGRGCKVRERPCSYPWDGKKDCLCEFVRANPAGLYNQSCQVWVWCSHREGRCDNAASGISSTTPVRRGSRRAAHNGSLSHPVVASVLSQYRQASGYGYTDRRETRAGWLVDREDAGGVERGRAGLFRLTLSRAGGRGWCPS